jgi:aquaporin Z
MQTYGTAAYATDVQWTEEPQGDVKVEAYISEFVGSFFLVLTVGFNVLQNTALAPISIGSILMAMIFATGKVSGGHFNPAVTLGVYCRGGPNGIDGSNAFGYMATQLLGGLVAGLVYLAILGASFVLQPGVGYNLGAAFIVEVLFTAALVFVVLSVATTKQDEGNWYYGLAIGFTVMAAAFAIGPISGCSLNPAVTFGVLFSNFLHTGTLRVSLLLLYTVAPFLGALLAVAFFQVIREQEYKIQAGRLKQQDSPTYSRPFTVSMPRSRDVV